MPPANAAPTVATIWLAAAGTALASGLVAAASHGLGPRHAAAFLYETEALGVALAAPWLAARVLEDEAAGAPGELARRSVGLGAGLAGAAVVALGLALFRESPGVGGALLAQTLVAILAVGLGSLALAVGMARGAGAGLAAGLAAGALLLGAPYLAGDAIAALPGGLEALAVYWLVAVSPGLALAGTCAGTDPFHSALLYERFRPVGEGHVGYEHASPLRALAVQGTLAAVAAGLAALARRVPRRAVAPAAFALALVVLAPSRAEAQVIDNSGGAGSGSGTEGGFGVQVHLGYLYPFIEGNQKIQHDSHSNGSRLDLIKDIHLENTYVLPTFEVQLGWRGIGRVWVDYFEMEYRGDFGGTFATTYYRNVVIPKNEVGLETYNFRTIGAHGAISIPVLDFMTLELIFTTRYCYFFSQVRAPRIPGLKDQARLESIVPGLGPGFEFFILDKLYGYGDLAWIDFTVPNKHPLVHYREGHLGLRYEFFPNLHVGGEVVWLEVDLQSSRFQYLQRIIGPRLWVALAF